MAKKSKSKVSKRKILDAFVIASKDIDRDAGESDGVYENISIGNSQHLNSDEENNQNFEDEEIDSEDVLGSDDEYDIMNSKFSQTIRDNKASRKTDKNINEESDGYMSIDEKDLVPLSAVWDMDDKDQTSETELSYGQLKLNDDLSDEQTFEDTDSESFDDEREEEENPFDEILDDGEDVELTTITSTLRKQTEQKQYKKLDSYAGGEENEFALPSVANSQKLTLTDMLNVVGDKNAISKASLVSGEQKVLSVPLPQRIQKRYERKAAYEISKDEIGKWHDTVQQNRQAKHLSFPINPQIRHNEASTYINNSDSPLTELERKVNQTLKESNLLDPVKESTFEEIAVAQMSPEEMRKRTTELRLMRELMFREERKAKRIKKIKSKAYRRIKKKEMLKNNELVDLNESDTDNDTARARQRMSLKHKTTSKWAKDMIKHGMTKDKETRGEMEEMLRQEERLRSKIMGHGSGSESDNDIDDIEDDKSNNENTLSSYNKVGKTGLLNMPFMKNAEARLKEQNRDDIEKLRLVEETMDIKLFEETNDVDGVNVKLNQGRRIYTPGVSELQKELVKTNNEVLEENNPNPSNQLEDKSSSSHVKPLNVKPKFKLLKEQNNRPDINSEMESNPWLHINEDDQYTKKSSKLNVVGEDSSKDIKKAHKIEKEKIKQTHNSKNHDEHEELLNLNNTSKFSTTNNQSDLSNNFVLEFKDQDAIAEAFAGDDVVTSFKQEKQRVAIDEDDKEEDITLLGWGEWAGTGLNSSKKRKFVKKIKGIVKKDKRKDKNLKNVIINEKVNKKNLKYQSSSVSFPYENKEQYERSLRMPIGQEWVSRSSHQKLIKPRILTKPNMVIDPLKAPFK